jgi:hypothetical protein
VARKRSGGTLQAARDAAGGLLTLHSV